MKEAHVCLLHLPRSIFRNANPCLTLSPSDLKIFRPRNIYLPLGLKYSLDYPTFTSLVKVSFQYLYYMRTPYTLIYPSALT